MLGFFTLALVVVILLLVIYTYNLGKISLFDRRHRVYESLLEMRRLIKKYDARVIESGRKMIEIALSGDPSPHQSYKICSDQYDENFGNIYKKFIFEIESSRFLYDLKIYKFLTEAKEKASIADEYIRREVFQEEGNSGEYKLGFTNLYDYFSNTLTDDYIVSFFDAYLRIEENICKIIYCRIKKICNWFSAR